VNDTLEYKFKIGLGCRRDRLRLTSTIICLYSAKTMFFNVSSTNREKFISYMVISDRVGCCKRVKDGYLQTQIS